MLLHIAKCQVVERSSQRGIFLVSYCIYKSIASFRIYQGRIFTILIKIMRNLKNIYIFREHFPKLKFCYMNQHNGPNQYMYCFYKKSMGPNIELYRVLEVTADNLRGRLLKFIYFVTHQSFRNNLLPHFLSSCVIKTA